ncbi:MAG: hypothetical protein J6W25_03600 [Bacilli bacterium]|nr:hypothetical protein [Bacilli bacterium]
MNNFIPDFNFINIDNAAKNLICCPDQFVAEIKNMKLSNRIYETISYYYDEKGVPKYSSEYKSDNKIIAVVLESPHIDEYQYINGVVVPKGPLIGSWKLFKENFAGLLYKEFQNLDKSQDYVICFINAIQYQCSLGKPLTGKNSYSLEKNRNVINAWYSGFNNDLVYRLKATNPDIIINLSGISMKISKLIDAMLKKDFPNVLKAYGTHPSRWNKNATRKIKQL